MGDETDSWQSEKMLETWTDIPFQFGSSTMIPNSTGKQESTGLQYGQGNTIMAEVNIHLSTDQDEQSGDSLGTSIYEDSSLGSLDVGASGHSYPRHPFDSTMGVNIAMDSCHYTDDAFNLSGDYSHTHSDLTADDAILSLAQRMCKIYDDTRPLSPNEQQDSLDMTHEHMAMTPEPLNLNIDQSHHVEQYNLNLPSVSTEGDQDNWCALSGYQQDLPDINDSGPINMHAEAPFDLSETRQQETPKRRFQIPRLHIIHTRSFDEANEANQELSSITSRSPDRLGSPRRWQGSPVHTPVSPDNLASPCSSHHASPEGSLTSSPQSSLASPGWPFSEHPSLLSPRHSSTESIPELNSSPSNTDSKRAHVLPPCRVCGAVASGFHYGANTCEACKGFFRRSMVRKHEYVCSKSKKCQIDIKTKRKVCAYCRYHKCLEAGMSRNGIKTGRYTYEKRTKDILEVQQLKRDESLVQRQSAIAERTSHAYEVMADIRVISEKHQSILDYEPQKADLNKYLEEQAILEETFGSLKPVDQEDFLLAYDQMGIELDNRRDVVDALLRGFEKTSFPRLITYIRDFPGFGPLKFSDVLTLIKYHFFDIWFLQCVQCISPSGHVTSTFQTVFEISQIVACKEKDTVLSIINRIKRLQLSLEENILLQAIVLLTSDQCDLEQEDTTESLLMTYVDILQCILGAGHPGDLQLFPKVMQVLADLRYISHVTRQGLTSTMTTMDKSLYPLMTEVIERFR